MKTFAHLGNTTDMALAKVLVLEDDHFARITISSLLSHQGFNIVGSVETAEEALEVQSKVSPDVLLADLDLGVGPSGIDVAHRMRELNPNIGVIILTSFSDPRLLDVNSLKPPQGSVFLTKGKLDQVSTLTTAILRAKNRPLTSIMKKFSNENLSDTQIQILRMVSEGFTTAKIAEIRGVSEKSIEAHLSKMHILLGLNRQKDLNPRVQLTRAYIALTGKSRFLDEHE